MDFEGHFSQVKNHQYLSEDDFSLIIVLSNLLEALYFLKAQL